MTQKVNDMILAKSDSFFSDITTTFSNYGASAWRAASETPWTIREFAINNNLIDTTEIFTYWQRVMAAWNQNFAGGNTVTCTAKIKITILLSSKTLRLLTSSVLTATGEMFELSDRLCKKKE